MICIKHQWLAWMSAQSPLRIFAQKYIHECEDNYFILQNKHLYIYQDGFGAKILRDDCALNLPVRQLEEHIYEICQRLLTWHWQYCANVQIPCMYTVWSDHLRWILWGWSAINWTCSRSLRSVSSKTECFTVFAVSDLIENRLVIYNIYQTKMGESSKKIQVSLMKIQYM